MLRWTRIATLAGAAIAVAAIAVYGRAHSGSLTSTGLGTPVAPAKRAQAPALQGATLAGGTVDLSRLRGKPVVINFFASWCAPCKSEGAAFAAVAHRYTGRVQFVGVAIDDSRTGARRYVQRYRWTWPVVFDPHDHLVGPYGLIGKPTTFVLDDRGRIVWKLQREVSASELSTAIDDVLPR